MKPEIQTKNTETEQAFLARINTAKHGKLIKVRMWTKETGSQLITAAHSLTGAVKLIRAHSAHYANWALTFNSEDDAN